MKKLIVLVSVLTANIALAGPADRLGRLDKRLSAAENRGVWEQGSRADRFEDRIDRREDRRDRAVTLGPRDLAEDRRDRAENRRDMAKNRPN